MRRMAAVISCSLLCAAVATAQTVEPKLWISDTATKLVYEVSLEGALLSTPFKAPTAVTSGLAVDPWDDTLWGASEGSTTNPGRLVNFTKTGVELSEIPAGWFGADRLEGVAVDFHLADSLWAVDDPDDAAVQPRVYQIDRSGNLIGSFPTPEHVTSPQGIACDPHDKSLWITDNATDSIYQLARDGQVLASFNKAVYDFDARNPQGISVDELNGSLWITDRSTDRIYNLSTAGELKSSFPSSAFEPLEASPTGISFDMNLVPDPDPDPTAGCGPDGGLRPARLLFAYTGEGCDASSHRQPEARCEDREGGPQGIPLLEVKLKKPSSKSARITPVPSSKDPLEVGERFALDLRKHGDLELHLKGIPRHSSSLKKKTLQKLKLKTDCSVPLFEGDVFGALELVGFE